MERILEIDDKISLRLRHLMEMSDHARSVCKTLWPEIEYIDFRVDIWYTQSAGKHIYPTDSRTDWPNMAAFLSALLAEDLEKLSPRFCTWLLERPVGEESYT